MEEYYSTKASRGTQRMLWSTPRARSAQDFAAAPYLPPPVAARAAARLMRWRMTLGGVKS